MLGRDWGGRGKRDRGASQPRGWSPGAGSAPGWVNPKGLQQAGLSSLSCLLTWLQP